jgi:hypothetical protein
MKFILATLLIASFSGAVFSKENKPQPKQQGLNQPVSDKAAATVCKKTGQQDWKIWGNVCPDGWHK